MDNKTLDELDPPIWPDAAEGDTYLVRRCHELREKPISEFTVEDLRITIGQQIGLAHLVPRALSVLAANPLAEGHMFPGDLLEAVMRVDRAFWDNEPAQLKRLNAIVNSLAPLSADVRAAVEAFRSRYG